MKDEPKLECPDCGTQYEVDRIAHTEIDGEPAWWCELDRCSETPFKMNDTLVGEWSVKFS